MSIGQWDDHLAAMYDEGAILLELDAHERPIRAYQRAGRLSMTMRVCSERRCPCSLNGPIALS